jgi:hypothetical protein
MFHPNDGFMYAIVAIVICFVAAQSVFFLVRAWRRARAIGMSAVTLRKIVFSSALFTIAPAVAILMGVITLSRALGYPLPWLRLSVIGALTYELPAAESAAQVVGASLSNLVTDPTAFATIAWVMTLGIIPGLILVPAFGEKIENSLDRLKARDKKWGDIFMSGLFMGMISAFLGYIFCDVSKGITGWIPVFVMLISACIMIVLGLLYKKTNARWLTDYALPLSMLGAMALSIPLTNLLA